jgi:hypothetical protein
MNTEKKQLEFLQDIWKLKFEAIRQAKRDYVKARRRREFILTIACLVGLLYIGPADLTIKPPLMFAIPFTSLTVPLAVAALIFPPVLTIIYLMWIKSVITLAGLYVAEDTTLNALGDLLALRTPLPKFSQPNEKFGFFGAVRIVCVPQAMQYLIDPKSTVGMFALLMAEVIVALPFTLLPYLASVLVVTKVCSIVDTPFLSVLFLVSFLVAPMLLALCGTIFSIAKGASSVY